MYDLSNDILERFCEDILLMDGNHSPWRICVKYLDNSDGNYRIYQDIFADTVGRYLQELNKLKYIFEKLIPGIVPIDHPNRMDGLKVPSDVLRALCPWSEILHFTLAPLDIPLQKIRVLSAQYLGHSWQARQAHLSLKSDAELTNKEQVMCKLFYAANLQEVKTILADNHQLLNTNRTSWSCLILKSIAVLISFPLSIPALLLYSSARRGTLNFFKSDSQVCADKIASEMSSSASLS